MSGSTSSSESSVSIKIQTNNRILPPEKTPILESLPNYVSILFLSVYTFVIIFGETLFLPNDEVEWCSVANVNNTKVYENPDFDKSICRYEQTPYLLFMTQDECDYARRMFISVLYGAIIGFERRSSSQPAGMRTMSLVSLGSCFFTMCSMNCFRSSTMHSDAARVSASIPSAVGFLGAALIWKGQPHGPSQRHEVHGLATASSVWLSAAIGIGVGGKLWVQSAYAVVLVVFLLKIGPRMYLWEGSDGSRTMFSFDDGWDTNSESNRDDLTDDDETFDPTIEKELSHRSIVTREEQRWLLEQHALEEDHQNSNIIRDLDSAIEYELTTTDTNTHQQQKKFSMQRAKSTSLLNSLNTPERAFMRRSKSEYEIYVPVHNPNTPRSPRRRRKQVHVTLHD